MSTTNLLETLTKKYPKHKRDAFALIFEGLERFLASQTVRRHIKAEELYAGIASISVEYWGPMASEVVKTFGITGPKDIGDLVEILINEQMLTKGPDDKMEDFYIIDGSFDEIVEACFLNGLETNPPMISKPE